MFAVAQSWDGNNVQHSFVLNIEQYLHTTMYIHIEIHSDLIQLNEYNSLSLRQSVINFKSKLGGFVFSVTCFAKAPVK